MKLNKKLLSCVLTASMIMAPMSALAADSKIIGEGDVFGVEQKVYNVVLPTSKSIAFKVDPYGMLTTASGAALSTVLSDAAGTVTSSATAIINKSSTDLNIAVETWFDQSVLSNSSVSLGALDEVEAGTKDLYLTIEHLSGAVLDSVATGSATALTGDNLGVVSGFAFDISTAALDLSTAATTTHTAVDITATGASTSVSGSSFNVSLGNVMYAYEVTTQAGLSTLTLSEGALKFNTNNVYAFYITGKANPESDIWNTLAEGNSKLGITMKFTISEGTGEGTVTYVDKTVLTTTDRTFNVTYPDGATSFSIVVTTSTGTNGTWSKGNQYTVSGNTVTIKDTSITNNKNGYITITFNDTSKTTATINLK